MVTTVKRTCASNLGISFSSLSMVFGGKGVVSPASLLHISSLVDADAGGDRGMEDRVESSEDLLLRLLPPTLLPSRIVFNGGGWVKK